MIVVCDRQNCCGCEACANICPRGCITMQPNREGFLYPHADQKTCMKCGSCSHVCPVLHKPQPSGVLSAYAARHNRSEIKLKSSSGGVFTALAESVLKEGGAVFGAAFDEEWNVVHASADNVADLDKLRRSKYVQSHIGKTFTQAKQLLESGRKVLFTGTPCQIAGLRNYLRKEYANLLTADIICHGVNSPAVWQQFLAQCGKKEKIVAVNFRHKRFGWDMPFLQITYKGGNTLPRIPEIFSALVKAEKGYLLRHFFRLAFGISDMYERPSCYVCRFKGLNNRMADFTLGDLWGNWPGIITPQDKKEGMSVLFVNTPKAQTYFEHIRGELWLHEVPAQEAAAFNPALEKSTVAHPKRAEFFARYRQENLSKLVCSLSGEKPFTRCVLAKGLRWLCQKVKSILH